MSAILLGDVKTPLILLGAALVVIGLAPLVRGIFRK